MGTAHEARIAIIGMACRFPGANSPRVFWQNLVDGRSAFGEVPADRWDPQMFTDPHARAVDKAYSTRLASLSDIRSFAPAFYGITPKRARVMDPQQRLLLDCAREAIEDAGYARRPLPSATTGVYVGVSVSEHKDIVTSRLHTPQAMNGQYGQSSDREAASPLIDRVPAFHAYTMVGQLLNMCAANISSAFDYGGPSFAIDTACSSSLVALHEAMLHLRNGIADAAIVGGVYLNLDPVSHVCFSRIGALSRTGVCAPFSAEADGFVLGEGAGAVVIKRLEDAHRDGDRIWAVIDGAAINNDARTEGPMTPRREGQVAVMRRAYRDAGISPSEITLLEAHGTATAAGDRTEVEALGEVFGADGRNRLLTSVKANVGHALAASGMASLIRTTLALHHRCVPRQAHFVSARAGLDLAAAGLTVPTETRAWQGPVRAAVSSFGFGGTNAHVVLSAAEQHPRQPRLSTRGVATDRVTIAITAPTPSLLLEHRRQLADALATAPSSRFEDVAYTLNATRRQDRSVVAVEASTIDELIATLREGHAGRPPASLECVEYTDCQVVSLPASPLDTRPFWVVADAEPVAAEKAATIDQAAADAVIAAISRVSALPVEQLTPDKVLGDQLGFDSLMSADLAGELSTQFPALVPDSQAWFDRSLTIGALIDRVSALTRNATVGAQPAAPGAHIEHVALTSHPFLRDHVVDGSILVPFAMVIEMCLTALRERGDDASGLSDVSLLRPIEVDRHRGTWLRVVVDADGAVRVDRADQANGPWLPACTAKRAPASPAAIVEDAARREASLTVADFYAKHTFHGPLLQALQGTPRLDDRQITATVRAASGPHAAVMLIDGALQAAAFWAATMRGSAALPVSVRQVINLSPATAGEFRCIAKLESESSDVLVADIDILDTTGSLVMQLRGLTAAVRGTGAGSTVSNEAWDIEQFPEVRALRQRIAATRHAGFEVPYFTLHEGTARATSRVDGREMISYSTYNYLGLSGDPAVTGAAVAAVETYGTTVSASRVAAGERPVHRRLESALARFLGCDDAIAMVGGHATNVTTIGHIVGPQDVIVYDALAHDSIVGGARQSGARHRSFPHNDLDALDRLLTTLRPLARRILICVEGAYSMDGDLVPLDRLIEIKRRHRALLLVDEAHSLGVIGSTGRGVGEHFDIHRRDVDLWMGTLSKALASCGGYIAGSSVLIQYLKYTAPGFVYSCGLSPANAAAALAAIEQIELHPERVVTLRERAELFRTLSRRAGIDCGLSGHSAVVPCIVGKTTECLRLAAALNERGIAVHPIIYPAVEESQARLRFFVSALHTEEQIRGTVEILAEELFAIRCGRTTPAIVTPVSS